MIEQPHHERAALFERLQDLFGDAIDGAGGPGGAHARGAFDREVFGEPRAGGQADVVLNLQRLAAGDRLFIDVERGWRALVMSKVGATLDNPSVAPSPPAPISSCGSSA